MYVLFDHDYYVDDMSIVRLYVDDMCVVRVLIIEDEGMHIF